MVWGLLAKTGANGAKATAAGAEATAAAAKTGGVKNFFFGSKLRTGLTAGTAGLYLGSENSYAMRSPAMAMMAMNRGMYPYGY